MKEVYDSAIYRNKNYQIFLYFKDGKIDKFKLQNTKNNIEFAGKPELVTIDEEIPEGTNRIDYNNPNDFSGYPCDSTYQFISNKVNIVFAIEKGEKKRLDLQIEGLQKSEITNSSNTLLKQN